jgi:hypothetical protein
MEHTPTPWRTRLDGHFRGWTYVMNDQREGVAMITENQYTLANARLVAAAPDLLLALKDLLTVLPRNLYWRVDIGNELLARAETAIRKAEQGE